MNFLADFLMQTVTIIVQVILFMQTVTIIVQVIFLRAVLKDNTRLRSGHFSPDELQNLCHNLTTQDRDAFKAGCTAYQEKLFGPEKPLLKIGRSYTILDSNGKTYKAKLLDIIPFDSGPVVYLDDGITTHYEMPLDEFCKAVVGW